MIDHTDRLRALGMARAAHKGQVDKAGRDYFRFHLLKVAKLVKERGGSEAAIITAILHDIVEDTDITLVDVLVGFGLDVSDAVDALTRREDETYYDYIDRVVDAGGIAREVKIADVIDHLEDVSHIPGSLIERYVTAAVKLGIAEEVLMSGVEGDLFGGLTSV